MEPIFLNSDFLEVDILTTFKSLIWRDKYCGYGDFEIITFPTDEILENLNNSKYLKLSESEHLMIIEYINIHTDIEEGDELSIKGRSLESILDRRIIWDPIRFNGNLAYSFSSIIHSAIIAPADTNRKINNFIWVNPTDPIFSTLEIAASLYGDNLYEAITDMANSKDIGYKITLSSNNEFLFKLYNGEDRSSSQEENDQIIFSPEFDNLINADYINTDEFLKTIALVVGEKGVANGQLSTTVNCPTGAGNGLERREIFIEANDIRRTVDGIALSESDYLFLLESRGKEELTKHVIIDIMDGEIDTSMFVYGEDFYMGDIVEIKDNYGHSSKSRIIEVIYSEDSNGSLILPIFKSVL